MPKPVAKREQLLEPGARRPRLGERRITGCHRGHSFVSGVLPGEPGRAHPGNGNTTPGQTAADATVFQRSGLQFRPPAGPQAAWGLTGLSAANCKPRVRTDLAM